MSTGLTIGGWFASAAIRRLVDIVSSRAVEQYGLRAGLQSEIRQLRTTLLRVHTLLSIVEGKRVEEGGHLDELLRELRDAALDADDLLDEFEYEVVRAKVESEDPQASDFFPFPALRQAREFFNAGDAAKKVREIQSRLEMVADGVSPILLLLRTADVTARRPEILERKTSSFIRVSDQVVGRAEESHQIVDWLLRSTDGSGLSYEMNPGVLPIVGVGGVGKTTLARHVYNHSSIQQHFELKMWVCVSENFDVERLTKEIIEDACHQRPNLESLNALQKMLKEKIMCKRFLLVLDDVWNEDRAKWEDLCAPLVFGSEGSKILVTTRSEKIASMMCTEEPIRLQGLAEDAYSAFFKSCAFAGRNCEDYPKLVQIGMTIAKRLRGSPLAAKTLGSLLSTYLDEKHWRSVMNSEIWELRQDQNDIMPVLELSYKQLPGHLKQCFTYCSLFPKDYEFRENSLVRMWLAQGFIRTDASKRLEDVGSHYCQELVNRSFFQHGNRKGYFVIHDLLHDLAQYVSVEECRRIEDAELESISINIHHLSVYSEEWKLFTSKSICGFKKLRTLVLRHVIIVGSDSEALHELFTELTSLRVLILKNCNLKELPDSIGNLKHLQYLDISWNRQLHMLPESLCRLYNLRVLGAWGCPIKSMPDGISNLIYLRWLKAEDDMISKIAGIGKLTSLQELNDYRVKKKTGHKITELRDMKELRGRLAISSLENVENKEEASSANLKDKMLINELLLSWSSSRRDINLPITDEEVLEGLEPHPNTESLHIDGYGGAGFPSWFNMQSNLESLQFENCSWKCLPPNLGQLPSLKSLIIRSIPAIKKIDDELHGNGPKGDIKCFPSLEKLEFVEMQRLEEWSVRGGGEGHQLFPVLRELAIRRCPKLRNILISREVMHRLTALTELYIDGCQEMMTLAGLQALPSIQRLWIKKCPKLLLAASSQQPQMDDDQQEVFPSIRELVIDDTSLLSLHPLRGRLPFLRTLRITDSLQSAMFTSAENQDVLLQNLTSLRRLELSFCCNLQSLPPEVHTLSSLRDLRMWSCSEIQSLPEKGLPTCLTYLYMEGCHQLLKERCQKKIGDDWHKIAHINRVTIRN